MTESEFACSQWLQYDATIQLAIDRSVECATRRKELPRQLNSVTPAPSLKLPIVRLLWIRCAACFTANPH